MITVEKVASLMVEAATRDVGVTVRNGYAFLSGSVDSGYEQMGGEEAGSRIKGVAGVQDCITVRFDQGNVELPGTVATWHEYLDAMENALEGGAKTIRSNPRGRGLQSDLRRILLRAARRGTDILTFGANLVTSLFAAPRCVTTSGHSARENLSMQACRAPRSVGAPRTPCQRYHLT